MSTSRRLPTHVTDAVFKTKSFLLTVRRHLQNVVSGPRRFPSTSGKLKDAPVIATSATPLWNAADTEQNTILTVGKVQNLRVAAKCLHGVEIPANTLFSFWAHVGCPHRKKGYVLGREIREGCLVPTVAGGLCQLSNALYDAALQAGYAIVERHRHSQIVPGSLAERDRDATVKWNYIDLRFVAPHAFRIEVELTADNLVVRFRGVRGLAGAREPLPSMRGPSKLNDCYSCGNSACLRHPEPSAKAELPGVTTYLIDDHWPEYAKYVAETAKENDVVIAPSSREARKLVLRETSHSHGYRIITLSRYQWIRSIRFRLTVRSKGNVFSAKISQDESTARAEAKRIPWNSSHIVVSQNLLPFLWKDGVLGGRTFDVMMTRLPFERLHERLDFAHGKYPESRTLRDFRVSQELIDLENSVLTHARCIITPHAEIAAMFAQKAVPLQWNAPNQATHRFGEKILFPASALGRKGAYEMRRLAKELSFSFVVIGKSHEDPDFWNGVSVAVAAGDPFAEVGLVIYPTYVEHQPRMVLRALAAGIRVISTSACGLQPAGNLTVVPAGDYEALREAVEVELARKPGAAIGLAASQ